MSNMVVYAAVDEVLIKVGSIDCYLARDGTLLGVPTLSTHDAPRYLKVTNEGPGRLEVIVERRLPI